jgi:hypothetical protein
VADPEGLRATTSVRLTQGLPEALFTWRAADVRPEISLRLSLLKTSSNWRIVPVGHIARILEVPLAHRIATLASCGTRAIF